MKKFVLYTAIFGEPGRFTFPEISPPDVDRFCFTDFDIESGCHQMIPVRKERFKKNDFYQINKMSLNHLDPIRRNRFVKICIPDEIFDNYEYSLYVDCKRPVKLDFKRLLSYMEPGSDFLAWRHRSKRDCLYEEGLFCIKIGKDTMENIMKQLSLYMNEKCPAHNGLYEGGMLFRRHTKELKEFMKLWWKQVVKYSFRDQISLPYVAWKYNMKVSLGARPK